MSDPRSGKLETLNKDDDGNDDDDGDDDDDVDDNDNLLYHISFLAYSIIQMLPLCIHCLWLLSWVKHCCGCCKTTHLCMG